MSLNPPKNPARKPGDEFAEAFYTAERLDVVNEQLKTAVGKKRVALFEERRRLQNFLTPPQKHGALTWQRAVLGVVREKVTANARSLLTPEAFSRLTIRLARTRMGYQNTGFPRRKNELPRTGKTLSYRRVSVNAGYIFQDAILSDVDRQRLKAGGLSFTEIMFHASNAAAFAVDEQTLRKYLNVQGYRGKAGRPRR